MTSQFHRFGLPKSETFPHLGMILILLFEVRPIGFRTHGLQKNLVPIPSWLGMTARSRYPSSLLQDILTHHVGRPFHLQNHHSHPNPRSCPFALQWQLQVSASGFEEVICQSKSCASNILGLHREPHKGYPMVFSSSWFPYVLILNMHFGIYHAGHTRSHFPACRCRMTSGKLSAAGGSIRSMPSSHGMLLPCLSAMSLSEFVWNHLFKKLLVSLPPPFYCGRNAHQSCKMLQEISPKIEVDGRYNDRKTSNEDFVTWSLSRRR